MKILFWLPGGFWDQAIGGVETMARTLAEELIRHGHEIYVLSFETYAPKQKTPENHSGIKLLRCGHAQLSQKEQLQTLKKLHTFIKNLKPDILHLHYTANTNLIYYLFLAKYIDCPQVMTTHGLLCEEHFPIYQQIAGKMTKIFCVSDYLSNISQQLCTKPHIRIYNGINCSGANYQAPAPLKSIRFLCVGRFTHEKAYDIAIEAFKKVVITHPQISLELVGDGIEYESLHQMAKGCAQIIFTGKLNHQASLAKIRSSHVILIPSRYESFGLVAIEAGLMGRTVIASRIGGLSEIVNEHNGMLIEPDNPMALAEAMMQLLSSESEIETRGRYAYHWTREHFLSGIMSAEYLKHYEQIWRQTHGIDWQLLAQQRTAFTSESSACQTSNCP